MSRSPPPNSGAGEPLTHGGNLDLGQVQFVVRRGDWTKLRWISFEVNSQRCILGDHTSCSSPKALAASVDATSRIARDFANCASKWTSWTHSQVNETSLGYVDCGHRRWQAMAHARVAHQPLRGKHPTALAMPGRVATSASHCVPARLHIRSARS